MPLLHEELDKDIVQEQADDHQHEIPEQLYPAMQGGLGEDNSAHQEKPRRETNAKGNEYGSRIRFQSHKPKVPILFMQDEIITDKENKNIQQCVPSATA